MGKQQNAKFYDIIFERDLKWTTPYTKASQYSLWCKLAEHVDPTDTILEIACGTGRLARMLYDMPHPPTDYMGIDFSEFGINHAKKLSSNLKFLHGDIFQINIIESFDFNTVIATEFLEHIHEDIAILKRLRSLNKNIKCLFTVPAGQSMSIKDHVRQFLTADDIYERYDEYIVGLKAYFVKPRFLITGLI